MIMNFRSRIRMAAGFFGVLATIAALTLMASATSPKFYPDDPHWVERDTQDASAMQPLEVDLLVDLTSNLFTTPGDPARVRARNVNTVDQVPDSSWFTNRIGHRGLTAKEIAIGPDMTSGPAAGPWTVTSSKSDGVTPGFTIKDSHNQLWFLKFDPPGYRGMTTGTEVMVTKLMWALGYHVPENHIAYLRRDRLVVGDGAKFTPAGGGKRRAMRLEDVDSLLDRADREADGSYRVVASKALPGKPIGRIRFYDTRPDDPNDVVPHEHRRELRGYGVFAAWLNHVDAKSINSLDTLVTENGRAFVRHHLLDFGSSLGSGALGPAEYSAGVEYLVEPREVAKRMVSFGFSMPKWRTTPFYESRAIGRLPKENRTFDPRQWKPRVPNQAFLHALPDDQFWAAQRIAAFSDEMLSAAVGAGQFGDPGAEAFLVKALAERRDAIARAYLPAVNPVVDIALDRDGVLTFRNVAVDADVARIPDGYRAAWSAFDNATGATRAIGETTGRTTRIEAPAGVRTAPGGFVKAELSAIGGQFSSWAKPVHAYFRAHDGGWSLVGFERMPER
jgi:hypothetical protein